MTNSLTTDGTVTVNINISSELSNTGCTTSPHAITSSSPTDSSQQKQTINAKIHATSSSSQNYFSPRENEISSALAPTYDQPPIHESPPQILIQSTPLSALEPILKSEEEPTVPVTSNPRPELSSRPLPTPEIMVTPSTPQASTPPLKLHYPPSLPPSKFTEWTVTTRQASLILFSPNTPSNSKPKYCMRTPRTHIGRLKRDHTLHLGSTADGDVVGFTRELPHDYLFTVGNPTVPSTRDSLSVTWPLENDIYKRCEMGPTMRWSFKGDLTKYGPAENYIWERTKTSYNGLGIEEMECRNERGMVVAAWSRGKTAFRGRLWMRKGKEWSEGQETMKIARTRWEVAMLLTWRLMLEWSIKKGDSRPNW